jgi:hypothetical protein
MWNSGWMVKTLDCGQGGNWSNPILDMLWTCHGFAKVPTISTKKITTQIFFGIISVVQECFGFILSLIQIYQIFKY